jgi:hypothetical protein
MLIKNICIGNHATLQGINGILKESTTYYDKIIIWIIF